ncbi:hypothetical protein DRO03_07570 [Methanosarcinales archaeon]|nr:MAG: hypothetical protein DRO03_07570 [Methanosarcinales archaeon]
MEKKYPLCKQGVTVNVPVRTDDEIVSRRDAGCAVVMEGCECGAQFEHIDDIVVDTVVEGKRVRVTQLHGVRCHICGMESLSQDSMRTVERQIRKKRSTVRFKHPTLVTHEPRRGIPV